MKILQRNLSTNELKFLYQHAVLTISQLSNHKRLKVTIPHKVFEAIYFERALASFSSGPLIEIFQSNKSFIEIPVGSTDEEIIDILNESLEEKRLANWRSKDDLKLKELYSQRQLAKTFLEIVSSHF